MNINYTILGILGLTVIIIIYVFRKSSVKEGLTSCTPNVRDGKDGERMFGLYVDSNSEKGIQVAKVFDDCCNGGIAICAEAQFYKMVKFDKDGNNIPNSGRYVLKSAYPGQVGDQIKAMWNAGDNAKQDAKSNYKYRKGPNWTTTCVPAATPASGLTTAQLNVLASPSAESCDGKWRETKGKIGGDDITDCKFASSLKDGKCGWKTVDEAKKGCWEWSECGGFTCMPNKKDPNGFCYAASVNQSACLNIQNVETHDFDAFHKVGGKCSTKPQDCTWGDWEDWSECAGKCGEPGSQTRKRKKLKEATAGGKCEGEAEQTRPCKPEPGQSMGAKPAPDYTTACAPPIDELAPKGELEIPYISQLPPAPSAVSLLGGMRPTKAQSKPATIEEDVHNRISYWQDKKNTDVVAKAISVSNKLKQQQVDEKKDPITGPILARDYSKPDLRMFPLLKSISNSLHKLTS